MRLKSLKEPCRKNWEKHLLIRHVLAEQAAARTENVINLVQRPQKGANVPSEEKRQTKHIASDPAESVPEESQPKSARKNHRRRGYRKKNNDAPKNAEQ